MEIIRKALKWRFVWNNTERFFSSERKQTVVDYEKGAIASFGKGCGHIEPMDEKLTKNTRRNF